MKIDNIVSDMSEFQLTQYTKGGGCGCKIAPAVLDKILSESGSSGNFSNLVVGSGSKDDAAVYDMGHDELLISTTDFFTPVVNDPFDFGRIASANAISDVYAMGGRPLMALAVLAWPVDIIPAEIAALVIKGARSVCLEAGIPLAGGHSINNPDPVFGLAVNGLVKKAHLKRNDTAKEGDLIYLTKSIGIGIINTAVKKGIVDQRHAKLAFDNMVALNSAGEQLGKFSYVNAMTDVTGFGLLGHIIEMAEGSNLTAQINFPAVQIIDGTDYYASIACFPDNVYRNWNSFQSKVSGCDGPHFIPLCDPQTNGGLLIAVNKAFENEFISEIQKITLPGFNPVKIGSFVPESQVRVTVNT